MSGSIHKVAISGATGSLGKPVTEALVKAGFEVIALTRDASTAKVPAGVKAITVDYQSEESLQKALAGQDALVSTLGNYHPGDMDLLFDTAIAQGVKRLIPSEFGSDTLSAESRSLPVYKNKVELQDHIKAKVAGTSSTYTFILSNAFLDWGLTHDFIFDRKNKKVKYYDGGDVPFTTTPISSVADAVVGVLKHPAETANRVVKVHGISVTQKQLVELYQQHTTSDGWQSTTVDTKEALGPAYEVLKTNPSDIFGWVIPMLARVAFARDADNNWEKINDNALVGVKETTPAQLDAYVKAAVLRT